MLRTRYFFKKLLKKNQVSGILMLRPDTMHVRKSVSYGYGYATLAQEYTIEHPVLIVSSVNETLINTMFSTFKDEPKEHVRGVFYRDKGIIFYPSVIDGLCQSLSLRYGYQEMSVEINAMRTQHGYCEINLNEPLPKITFDQFERAYHEAISFYHDPVKAAARGVKDAYSKIYSLFGAPAETMQNKLDVSIKTIKNVKKYAKENPNSLTATVIDRLRFG